MIHNYLHRAILILVLYQWVNFESQKIPELLHYCPIKAHLIVKKYQKLNYLGGPNLFWLSLRFNRGAPWRWEGVNRRSAIDHPSDTEAYLSEELSHKAIVGPFKHHPCPGGDISPVLTREKAKF